jgi:hypothetical protein
MIEMPNSEMIPHVQELSSLMDSEVLTTTTMIPKSPSANLTMTEDMVFNAGHRLSIIVYRFVTKTKQLSMA